MRAYRVATVLVGLLLASCGDTQGVSTPRVVYSPSSLVFNTVPIGGQDVLEVRVENRGKATLRISGIRVDASTGFITVEEPQASSFDVPEGGERSILLAYQPTSPEVTQGTLRFRTNDPGEQEVSIPLSTPRPTPIPLVQPQQPDFGTVPVNTTATIPVLLRNVGLAPLVICDILVAGNNELGSNLPQILSDLGLESGEHLIIDLWDYPTGVGLDELGFDLRYAPTTPGDDSGVLNIVYDTVGEIGDKTCADDRRLMLQIPIEASAGTSALDISPCPLDFGERGIDITHKAGLTLTNVGTIPLEIVDIHLDPARTAASFSLGALPPMPFIIAGDNTAWGLELRYRPRDLVAEAGSLIIESVDQAGELTSQRCTLAGVGVEATCPVPVVTGWIVEDVLDNRQGSQIDWAEPLQTIVLDGTASRDPTAGDDSNFYWEVESAPEGIVHGLRPWGAAPDNPLYAEFMLLVSGRYKFCLVAEDPRSGGTGEGSECDRACVEVYAIPNQAITIELTWRNPGKGTETGDPDETDGDGSDMDLHFLKMPAAWGDPVHDTYYGNPAPSWDPELPSLDRDDTDGAGPETIQLNNPEACQWYAVGAHYFRKQYGPAWATVRIHVNGRTVSEQSYWLDRNDDFWDVARIHWSGSSATIVQTNTLLHDFELGTGIAPPVTDEMRALGLCGLPE